MTQPVEAAVADDCGALLAAIRGVAAALLRPAEASRLYRTLAEEAATLLATESATVCTLEPEGDTLRVHVGTGLLASHEGELWPLETSFAGQAVLSERVRHETDLSSMEQAFRPDRPGPPAGPTLALPLMAEGRPVGVLLAVRSPGQQRYSDDEIRRGEEFARIAAASLENSRLFDAARGGRASLDAWRHAAELEAWRSRYEMLAEADRKVAFEWDLGSNTILWGGSLEAVFGYRSADFGTTPGAWADRLHDDDRGPILEGMRSAADRDEPFRFEGRLRHAAGGYRQVVVRGGSPIESRGAFRVVGAIDDMTDRGQGGTDRERKARLGAARDIVRGLRHEINNPLAVVMGQAQLLQKEPAVSGDPLLRQSITAIFEESSRLERLMKQLEELESSPREPFLNDLGGLNLPKKNGS